MPSALSADLRERVARAIEAGASRREAAPRFEVSPARAVRWHETFVREGRTRPSRWAAISVHTPSRRRPDLIRQTCEVQPGRFLHELGDRLAERGLRVGVNSLSRLVKRDGITRKTLATRLSRIGKT